MIITNTIVTIDETTTATASLDKEKKFCVIKFSNNSGDIVEDTHDVSLAFSDIDSLKIMLNIVNELIDKMSKNNSGIILPDKTIKTI